MRACIHAHNAQTRLAGEGAALIAYPLWSTLLNNAYSAADLRCSIHRCIFDTYRGLAYFPSAPHGSAHPPAGCALRELRRCVQQFLCGCAAVQPEQLRRLWNNEDVSMGMFAMLTTADTDMRDAFMSAMRHMSERGSTADAVAQQALRFPKAWSDGVVQAIAAVRLIEPQQQSAVLANCLRWAQKCLEAANATHTDGSPDGTLDATLDGTASSLWDCCLESLWDSCLESLQQQQHVMTGASAQSLMLALFTLLRVHWARFAEVQLTDDDEVSVSVSDSHSLWLVSLLSWQHNPQPLIRQHFRQLVRVVVADLRRRGHDLEDEAQAMCWQVSAHTMCKHTQSHTHVHIQIVKSGECTAEEQGVLLEATGDREAHNIGRDWHADLPSRHPDIGPSSADVICLSDKDSETDAEVIEADSEPDAEVIEAGSGPDAEVIEADSDAHSEPSMLRAIPHRLTCTYAHVRVCVCPCMQTMHVYTWIGKACGSGTLSST